MRRVHAKSSAQAPNKKRHLCVPEPELRLHHILGPAFCSSDQTSYSQKREVLHPSTGTRPVYYTHILYSLLISRWDRQSGAAESAPLYTNHFIARRPYNIPWWAWSLRPRRPTMSCAAPPPPPPAAGRQAGAALLHIMLRVSSSGIDRAEHHNTCNAHSLVLERKKLEKYLTILCWRARVLYALKCSCPRLRTHLNEK